jgi:hypothetical protein
MDSPKRSAECARITNGFRAVGHPETIEFSETTNPLMPETAGSAFQGDLLAIFQRVNRDATNLISVQNPSRDRLQGEFFD